MEIEIPKLSLIVLMGTSGSGKSTFAEKHFSSTQVLSSDYCRALVSDDENNMNVTEDAFDMLFYIAAKRLAAGKLVVIDATNIEKKARQPLVELARKYHVIPVAIILDIPEKICHQRNAMRPDKQLEKHVIRQQRSLLRRSIKALRWEGFRHIYRLRSEAEIDSVRIKQRPMWNDKTDEHGPFDIIGDVHGCYEELIELVEKLGYEQEPHSQKTLFDAPIFSHPEDRKLIFLGDIIDRGPHNIKSLQLVANMVDAGKAYCMPGNHEMKFLKKLKGKDVHIVHGLAKTLKEVENLAEEKRDAFIQKSIDFISGLYSHFVFDDGHLVVSHAGIKEEMQGRGSGKIRQFCFYGETTGETDEFGLPVRHDWAVNYRGSALVVYGHTPVPEAEWLNKTINIDTGCVFGGKLTAFRYPEKELVSVKAKQIYSQSVRPLKPDSTQSVTIQEQEDDLLNAEDYLKKQVIHTPLRSAITIQEENASAAFESMARFAVDPKWLLYLPPTMSPSETSKKPDYLEYPSEAFHYYFTQGVSKVVCEEKHMGSRAVVIICQDKNTVFKRFGIKSENTGIVYTRSGRNFFHDRSMENIFIDKVKKALDKADFWNELNTSWVCLDCELMPWSAKAMSLLKTQYSAVGSAARAAIEKSIAVVEQTLENDTIRDESEKKRFEALYQKLKNRKKVTQEFINAYQHYCWPVESIDDYKLAPFHILATEGKVHTDKNHEWHMTQIEKLCKSDSGLLLDTPYKTIDLTVPASVQEGISWWEELTSKGGEGMVVKPLDFIARGIRGVVQPALKCRGREYLRIIYGPEYTFEENLSRLKTRGLSKKRSLAMREFALSIEALERFVRKEPLRRFHQCVFGILALESEPVDPRL